MTNYHKNQSNPKWNECNNHLHMDYILYILYNVLYIGKWMDGIVSHIHVLNILLLINLGYELIFCYISDMAKNKNDDEIIGVDEGDVEVITPEKEAVLLDDMDVDDENHVKGAVSIQDKGTGKKKKRKRKSGAQRRKGKREGKEGDVVAVTKSDNSNLAVPSTSRSVKFPSPSYNYSKLYRIPKRVIGRELNKNEKSKEEPRNPKRGRGTPEEKNKDGGNIKRVQTSIPMSYRSAAERALSVIVHPKDNIKGRISASEYACIQEELRGSIIKLNGTTQIRMGGLKLVGDRVIAECHDETTKLWVEGEISAINGGQFQTSDITDKVVRRTVGVWVREKSRPKPDEFFPTITIQNSGLDTSDWTIIHCSSSNGGQFLLIRMNKASHDAIQPPKKVYYFTDVLNFSFEPPPPGAEEKEEHMELS